MLSQFRKYLPSIFNSGLGVVSTFLLQIYITNNVSSEIYGEFVYILSIAGISAVLISLGLGMSQIREIPRLISSQESKVFGFRNLMFFVWFCFSLFGFLASFFINDLIYKRILLVIPLMALFSITNNSLKAFKKPAYANLAEPFAKNFLFICFIFISIMLFGNLRLDTILLSYSISLICCIIFSYWLSWGKVLKKNSHPTYDTKLWIKVALPMLFLASTYLIAQSTDVILISNLMSSQAVAQYFVLFKLASIILMFNGVIRMVIMPKISELYAKNDFSKISLNSQEVSLFSVIFGIIICIIFFFLGDFILSFYGEDYVGVKNPLLVLSLFFTIVVSLGPNDTILQMTSYERETLYTYIFFALLNIFLNFLLIQYIGITGAVIATGLAMITLTLITKYLVKKFLKIKTSFFY
tara:strand:+ start:8080 stop:9312 length:1233 start_codon:yes stop_codon:yes gene_type:complete